MIILFEKIQQCINLVVIMQCGVFSMFWGKMFLSLVKNFFSIQKDALLLLMLVDSFAAVYTNLG